MPQLLFSFILLTFMLNTSAQYTSIPLYDCPTPGNKDVESEEIRTTSESGSAILTNVTNPELWHFAPASDTIAPAIIICPGGGYRYQAYDHEGIQVAQWLSDLGYHAFVLKYRLPDETLFVDATYMPLADARQAILTVRRQAEDLGIDPKKTGIMGFSAGGHLAASASVLFEHKIPFSVFGPEVRPDFSILVYPVISMTDALTHNGSRDALLGADHTPKLVNLFSLENQVTQSAPPTFIIHAADDHSVSPDNTKAFANALRSNNIPVKEIILPNG
jgi:acetyl esterase/lipase